MKITTTYLRQVIKEELDAVMNEAADTIDNLVGMIENFQNTNNTDDEAEISLEELGGELKRLIEKVFTDIDNIQDVDAAKKKLRTASSAIKHFIEMIEGEGGMIENQLGGEDD